MGPKHVIVLAWKRLLLQRSEAAREQPDTAARRYDNGYPRGTGHGARDKASRVPIGFEFKALVLAGNGTCIEPSVTLKEDLWKGSRNPSK